MMRKWLPEYICLTISLLVCLTALSETIFRHRAIDFRLRPADATQIIYRENPFVEALEISRYIRNHSAPDSRIAVLGSDPELYFYSRRHSATGYIYMYPLMEPQAYAVTMQQDMIGEIEAAKPEIIVFLNIHGSWLAGPDSNPLIFNWFEAYGPSHYRTVGLIDIQETATIYRWDDKAIAVRPHWTNFIRVFKRNDVAY